MLFFAALFLLIQLTICMEPQPVPTYLLLGCSTREELEFFMETFVLKPDTRFSVSPDVQEVAVVDVQSPSVLSKEPFRILSMHAYSDHNEGIYALLKHVDFKPISGILTAVSDSDELADLISKHLFTNAAQRCSPINHIQFSKHGKHNYMHMGETFTFWGSPKEESIMVQAIFRNIRPVKFMDILRIYLNSLSNTRAVCGDKGVIFQEYFPHLFNTLVAAAFPWKLLERAIELKDPKMISYLTGVLSLEHLEVVFKHFPDIPALLEKLDVTIEPEQRCSPNISYHESFNSMTEFQLNQLVRENEFKKTLSLYQASLDANIKEESRLLSEYHAARDADSPGEMSKIGHAMDRVALTINRIHIAIDELREKYEAHKHESMQQEADLYLI